MAGIIGYGASYPAQPHPRRGDRQGLGGGRAELQEGADARGEVRPFPRPGHDHHVRRGARSAPSSGPGSTPARSAPSMSGRNRIPTPSSRAGPVLAEAIGATPDVHTADLEFACKAGTEGMFIALNLVRAGRRQVRSGRRGRHVAGSARRRARILRRGRARRPSSSARTGWWRRSSRRTPTRPTCRTSGAGNTCTIPGTAAGSRATRPTSPTSRARPGASWPRPG